MAKTRHFGKITAFMAFDKNHSFRDYLPSLLIVISVLTQLLWCTLQRINELGMYRQQRMNKNNEMKGNLNSSF